MSIYSLKHRNIVLFLFKCRGNLRMSKCVTDFFETKTKI